MTERVQTRKGRLVALRVPCLQGFFTHGLLTFHLPWVLCKRRHKYPFVFILKTGIWTGFENFSYHLLFMASSAAPNMQQLVCAKRKEPEYSWHINYQKNMLWSNNVVYWCWLSWLSTGGSQISWFGRKLLKHSSHWG